MDKDFSKGFACECCGQWVQYYHRNINTSMALVLILMCRSGKRDYWHIEKWLKEIGRPELRADYHKLRFWGLIEAKIVDRDDGSPRNGYYKITGRGIMFAEGKLMVQKTSVIFNNKFQYFDGKEINIRQALSKKFNFDELMNRRHERPEVVHNSFL